MSRNSNTASKFSGGRGGDPKKAQQLLQSTFKQYGLEKKIARYTFVTAWDQIVGPEVAKRSRPECLQRGVLTVRVCDSVWAQELGFRKAALIERLESYLDHSEEVNDIRFYVDGSGKGY